MCIGTAAQPQIAQAQAAPAPQPVQQPAQPTGSLIPASQDTRNQQGTQATATIQPGQAAIQFVPLRQRQEQRQQTLLGEGSLGPRLEGGGQLEEQRQQRGRLRRGGTFFS